MMSIDLRRERLTEGNNFEKPQDRERVAVTTTSKGVHIGKVACGNPWTKNIVKVYDNLLGFAVKSDTLIPQLNFISQEWENADETRDCSQCIKGFRRLSLRNIAGINTRQKTLTKAANNLLGGQDTLNNGP